MAKRDILSMTLPELSAQVEVLGQPGYRSRQIFGFLHNKLAGSFDEMTNLPKPFRAQLDDSFVILGCTIEKKLVSCYDNTVKYLFRLNDGEYIECVVMRYKYPRAGTIPAGRTAKSRNRSPGPWRWASATGTFICTG